MVVDAVKILQIIRCGLSLTQVTFIDVGGQLSRKFHKEKSFMFLLYDDHKTGASSIYIICKTKRRGKIYEI